MTTSSPREMVDLADLVDRAGISAEFGVTPAAVTYWTQRADFPQPIREGRYRLYRMSEVRAWAATNRRPRGSRAEHGTATRYVAGCRCVPCTRANTRRCKRQRYDRAQQLAADPSLARHGSVSTYRNYGCRCAPCTVANSAACRDYKQRRGGE